MKSNSFIEELIKSRYLTYYLTLGFGLIFLIYALVVPRTYRSEGKVLPQMDIGGMVDISGMMGGLSGQESQMMRVARAAGISLGYSSADIIAALLSSRTVMESVIRDCDIFTVYRIKKNKMEDALKQLKTLTEIEITKEDIVRIKCMGKTRKLAAKMVDSYIQNLDTFLREKSMSKGKNMRMFVEKRLADADLELRAAAESLKTFQERNKIVIPDEELKAAIEAYAGLKAQLFAKEVQADIAKRYSSEKAPYYLDSRVEVEVLKKKIGEMELRGILKEGFGIGFGISFSEIPEVMEAYFRKYLDLKIQEEVYAFLRQQYEQARIMEIKDTPVITVLDWGNTPERKHSPRVSMLFVTGLVIGLILSMARCALITLSASIFRKRERKQLLQDLKYVINSDIRKLRELFTRRRQ
jgi:capsule polysaccharide export protein KpsE/RkpR